MVFVAKWVVCFRWGVFRGFVGGDGLDISLISLNFY